MTTPIVPTVTDELIAELEAAAVSINGWNMPVAFQEPEEGFLQQDWEWHVGQIDEDNNRYPLLHVNAHQYDSDDSEKLARYYAACNRDTILALLAHIADLKRQLAAASVDAERWRYARADTSAGKSDICVVKKIWSYGRNYTQEFILTGADADETIDAARNIGSGD